MTATQTLGTAVSMVGVGKTYGESATAVHALKGIDLEVPSGQFVVLLGPSGSGKTTLLNLVGAIDEPTTGSIRCGDIDVTGLPPDELPAYRRNMVGFVFQFFNLIPTLTALENVELIAELTGPDQGARSERALAEVGLADRMGHFPSQLSGGEQQRVAIARALAKETPVLLADEPTGELDFETGRSILALLRRLNRDHGRTVLLVTHNAAIGEMADRVLRLHSGTIVEDRAIDRPAAPEEVTW